MNLFNTLLKTLQKRANTKLILHEGEYEVFEATIDNIDSYIVEVWNGDTKTIRRKNDNKRLLKNGEFE